MSLFHRADFGPLPLLRRPLLSYIRAVAANAFAVSSFNSEGEPLARLGSIDDTKDSETLTRREQLLAFWLFRRAAPSVRPPRYTFAWAVTFINWYARWRHKKACRVADAEDDQLLCRALAGDVDASLQLSMSSSSDPRQRGWQNWNRTSYWQTAMIGLFMIVCALQLVGNVVDWVRGVDSRPRVHEFQQCGPYHHWIDVGGGDLSCEADR